MVPCFLKVQIAGHPVWRTGKDDAAVVSAVVAPRHGTGAAVSRNLASPLPTGNIRFTHGCRY